MNPKTSPRVGALPEVQTPTDKIVIYVCPTKGCGDFYGAPEFRPDRSHILEKQVRRNSGNGKTEQSHSRIECPSCRAIGRRVDRIPYIVTGMVPLQEMVKSIN